MLQYGYLTFFAVAFPLVSVCALLNNTVEIRTDASKLCKSFQRPMPEGAEDIVSAGHSPSCTGCSLK